MQMTFNMMKICKTIIYFSILSVLLFACGDPGKKEEKKTEEKKDSLIEKLNSPQLKALNAKLLKDPNNAALYSERAKLYMGLKQFEEAVGDALRAMNLDSTKAEYYITLADVYFASNKTRYSKEMLEAAVKKFPENTEALLKLAELFFLVKQYENSLTYINKALKIDENISRAYYLKGSVYKELGDTTKAISSITTAVEQDNTYFNAFLDLGILYASRKNPLAFEYYNTALRLKPNDENVLYDKAKLLQDLDKIDESIGIYEQLLYIYKNNKDALYNLGAVYLNKKKEIKKAVDYFSKAIAVDPQYTEAYFARGVCFQVLKDYDNARADFNMCLGVTKNYEPAIEALNELEKLSPNKAGKK
jgi:tetratricopeptide (TPR) repeat protein